jgi:hypothetical protein
MLVIRVGERQAWVCPRTKIAGALFSFPQSFLSCVLTDMQDQVLLWCWAQSKSFMLSIEWRNEGINKSLWKSEIKPLPELELELWSITFFASGCWVQSSHFKLMIEHRLGWRNLKGAHGSVVPRSLMADKPQHTINWILVVCLPIKLFEKQQVRRFRYNQQPRVL